MAKRGKAGKSERKKKLEVIGKKLKSLDRELARIERDLRKSRSDEGSIVDEDMKVRQRGGNKARFKQEENIREEPEYKGVKLFYRKFVSRLKGSLK
jgi:hypothetical protein